ncbi:phage tail tape measure protein [Rhizobium ruizarguesonis]|uniref:hypothetical protein n=1 Tax=Rhizobium ruizarguesonis TaxID=2081791 RepID=UPI0010321EA7|nr:hypothetical protein [Rhizobium ruizarguesonis]TAW18450.1 hypothetical protein ELI25_22955 [Rhizobium ruizarguesonis]TAZ54041.1 hypothetical protein ELH76_24225 [Rhizobium ruizarguesonis]
MAANAEASVTLSLIDRVTGPIKRIAARISAISKRIGLDRVGRSITNIGNRFRGLADGIGRTSGRLAGLLGLLGAGGAGAIATAYGLAKSASDVGSEIHDMAAQLGIGTQTLSEYLHVADQAGASGEAFAKGVEKLGINAVEASKGNKQLAAAFRSLGVHVKGSGGKLRSAEEILDDTMLALTKIKDPLKRNALAFKVFGKSGVELTKMLADGAEGIKAGREEARKLGIVWSQDAANAADAFGDGVNALGKRLNAFKTFVGVQLLPVINDAVEGINNWLDANSGLIRSKLAEWVQRLGGFVRALIDPTSKIRIKFDEFATSIGNAYSKVKPFVDFIGGPMNAALGLIGIWALAPAITAITLLATAFGGLALSIAGVGVKTIGLALSGIKGLFSGMAGTAATAGTTAGATYGNAFSKSLRGAVRLGLLGLGAYAASQIIADMPTTKEGWTERLKENKAADDARSQAIMDSGGGAVNKALGFDFFRQKDGFENSPAKKLLDGIKGLFVGSEKPVAGLSGSLAVADALAARRYGLGGSTTDTAPGKAKDDAAMGAASSTMITQGGNQTTINNTMNATVNVTAPAGADAAAIGKAVRQELDAVNRRAASDVKSKLSD